MSMITREPNLQRKSHRVDLPLYVEIEGKTCPAKDWSTTGVGLTGLEKAPEVGAILPAKIVFPMIESVLAISVKLVFKAKRGDMFGFEFHEMSARNKRVLRYYIELAIEGKLENLENLVAVTTMPGVRSPIEDALNFSELESEGVLKEFKKRSYLTVALGVVFLVTVVGLLYYNIVYKIEGTGLISGNIERVTANSAGMVRTILVKSDTFVDVNTPLFTVEDPGLRSEIEALDQDGKQLVTAKQPSVSERVPAEKGLLSSLRDEYEQHKVEFANAQYLYQKQIISNKDLFLAATRYYQVRTNYLKLKQEAEQTVYSPSKGRIFQINKTPGEYVKATDPVVLLESDVTPTVLVRLLNDDVLKLSIGMPATVYVPYENKKYQAVVSAVGHAAVNADSTMSMESSLNETIVKLDFIDKQVRLPANIRVKVWIRTLFNTELP